MPPSRVNVPLKTLPAESRTMRLELLLFVPNQAFPPVTFKSDGIVLSSVIRSPAVTLRAKPSRVPAAVESPPPNSISLVSFITTAPPLNRTSPTKSLAALSRMILPLLTERKSEVPPTINGLSWVIVPFVAVALKLPPTFANIKSRFVVLTTVASPEELRTS